VKWKNVEYCSDNKENVIRKAPATSKKSKVAAIARKAQESNKKAKETKQLAEQAKNNFDAVERLKKEDLAMQIRVRLEAAKLERLKALNEELKQQQHDLRISLNHKQDAMDEICERLQESTNKLVEVNKQIKVRKQMFKYHQENKTITGDGADEVAMVCDVLEKAFMILKGKHNATKAKLLIECILNGKLLKGEATKALNEITRQYIHQLFRPWKLVKAGDVSAIGCFKTSTITALRTVIDDEGKGYFPCESSVSRSRKLLDNHGEYLVGWERKETQYGEVYFLNFEKTLRLLLKSCKLDKLAEQTSVKIALAVDGAEMFHCRTHVSCGCKITDERGVHPVTGKPFMFTKEEAPDEINYLKVHFIFFPFLFTECSYN
jgi:hypothetical protein